MVVEVRATASDMRGGYSVCGVCVCVYVCMYVFKYVYMYDVCMYICDIFT